MALSAAAWAVIGTAAGGSIGVVGSWVTNLMNNRSSEKLAEETRRHDLVVAQDAALRTARERIYPKIVGGLRNAFFQFQAEVTQLKSGDWNIDPEKFNSGEGADVWNEVMLYAGEVAAKETQQFFQLRDELMEAMFHASVAIHECADGTPNPLRSPYNPAPDERNEALAKLDTLFEAFGQTTDNLLQALRDDITSRPGTD